MLELKQVSLDDTAPGFELCLRDLAAGNWSDIASILGGAGAEVDPEAEDPEGEISRHRVEFEAAAEALLASDDETVADADIASLADWLAHRFETGVNERRQRQLGVTHYIWLSQDDEKMRPGAAPSSSSRLWRARQDRTICASLRVPGSTAEAPSSRISITAT